MEDYTKIDVLTYVKNGLESGLLVPVEAEKYARIMARPGTVGEKVISWSADSEGNEIKEKVDTVSLDEETNNPGWIATKTDENGNIILDNNGYKNEWIIPDSTFNKKYEIDGDNPTLFKPKEGIQTFVQIPDNIILNQWGSDMMISAGGYINITNPDDMYGISKRDFEDTYKVVNTDELEKGGPTL